MDHKLNMLKDEFETSISTSFTEQDKRAVLRKIKHNKPNYRKHFLPATLTAITFVVACVFILMISSNGGFQFNMTSNNNAFDANEEEPMLNKAENNHAEEPDISGYVMEVNEGSILVVSTGIKASYNAIYFSNAPNDVQVGDYVKVWADGGVAESYPGQASVKNLEVGESKEHEGAQMTEAEAIRKIIEYGKETGEYPDHPAAIKSIDFDPKTKIWTIAFFDTETNTTFHISIQDQQAEAKPVAPHETLLLLNSIHSPFDPETINTDDVAGHFLATSVENNDGVKIITFEPSQLHPLSGTLVEMDEWQFRMSVLDLESIGLFPVANDDIGTRIQFKLEDKDMIQILDHRYIDEKIINNVNITISKVVYEYSETNTSTIILYVDHLSLEDEEYELQTFNTTVELDDELEKLYSEYSETHDDKLLAGLEPIQVFKLYIHAGAINDEKTIYELYLKDDSSILPDEETFYEETAGAEVSLYDNLKTLNTFVQLKDGNEALIRYDHELFGYFGLSKDEAQNVWKVNYLPIQ